MKLVVFDFDGTLVESRLAIAATFAQVLERFGHPPVPDEAVIALIGLPLSEIVPRLVAAPLSEEEVLERVDAFRAAYLAQAAIHEAVYPGIPAMLGGLRAQGRRMAVATGKSTSGAYAGAHRHGLHGFMDLLLGFDAVARPKPHPEMLLRIMEELGHGPLDTVMVGDTAFDVDMGRAAGVRTIGVTWGSHGPAELSGADHLVDTVAELGQALGLP